MLTRGLIGGSGGGGGGGGGGPTIDTADTTAAPQTVTLPALPAAGERRIVVDIGGNAETNPITIATTGADTIEGQAEAFILQDGGSLVFISDGTEWRLEGEPTLTLSALGGYTATDHYQSPQGVLSGVAAGFSVEALVTLREEPFSEILLATGSGNTGFRLQFSFATQLRFNAWDTGGGFVDAFAAIDVRTELGGVRPLHIVGTLEDGGGFFTVRLYLNGVLAAAADNFGTPNPYAPAGGTDRLGVGYDVDLAAEPASNVDIFGASYDANRWTNAQITRRYEEIKRAGRLIAGSLDPDNRWDGLDNLDGAATWPDVGSATAQDLSLVGSLTPRRRIWRP